MQTPCEAYGEQVGYCYNPVDGALALMYCNDYQVYLEAYYLPACVTAFEDFLICLSNLSCVDFMGLDPCPVESAAFSALCV